VSDADNTSSIISSLFIFSAILKISSKCACLVKYVTVLCIPFWNKKINSNEKSLYCWHKNNFRKKYLRQPSIDFNFCNISSCCDVVYKGRWLTQAGISNYVNYIRIIESYIRPWYNSANFTGPSKGTLHTQLVIMLKHSVFLY
jgi:hypothetical protein